MGFFITARGRHTVKESIDKLVRLPTIYAFIIGILVNLSNVNLGQIYLETVQYFRGAYTVCGMMIIGLGLSNIRKLKFDYKFILTSFTAKFLIWPVLISFVNFIDKLLFNIYDANIHRLMMLMSVVPIAANTVAYATVLKAQPEKASLVVVLSTLLALFYLPLIIVLFLK